LILVAKWIAAFPLAAVYTHSIWIVVWIVFVYAMVTLLIVLPRKYPGILVSLGTIGLCAALFASWLPSMMDDCRVTVLDVGQGQSIILQSNGKTFLVDCGGSYDDDAADIAAEYLLSMGVFRIDGMILTHYDRDHAGGALSFLSRMEVDALYLPTQSADSDLARQLLSCDRVHRIENDTVAQYDSVKLTFFTSKQINSKNESSLCVLFQAADCDILITGDRSAEGELELLENAEIPQLEILIAGHHGSKNSTTQPLLEVTRPQVVVISAGENNPYGHPAQELLDRLEEYGCIVFRTDRDGTITIRR
jgi:competence protein ComEC